MNPAPSANGHAAALPACFGEPEPESIRFAGLIAGRATELVFVAEDAAGAAALRGFGLVAVARPDGGRWSSESLRPLLDREVAIVNTDGFGQGRDWCERDRAQLEVTARRIGVFTPVECRNRIAPAGDLGAVVDGYRCLAFGPAAFVREARAALEDMMPRVEPPDPAVDSPPLRLGQLPDGEPFPLEVLPEPAARLVREVAAAVGCDPGWPPGR